MAGCYYLARLTDKIRLEFLGQLSDEYRPYLFHKHGADTQFLNFFGLSKEEVIAAVKSSNNDDAQMAAWFEKRTGLDDAKRTSWNQFSENLGKEGYPMVRSLTWAKAHFLPQCTDPTIDTVFKAI